MRHVRLIAFAVVLAMALLSPQTAAAAGKPLRFPSQPPIGTFDAGLLCPFPVYTEPVGHIQTVTLFFDTSGNVTKITFTGAGYELFRNVNTGKTAVLNVSGEGTLIPQADGSTLGFGAGPGLFGLFPGDSRGPALLQVFGRDTFRITAPDANGVTHITNLVLIGRVIDVCALLAA